MNDDPVEHEDDTDAEQPVEETTPRRTTARKRSASSPKTPARPAPAPQGALRVKILKLRNRSGTLLFLPVLNGDGTKKSLRMGANAIVEVPEDQLTDHARRLLTQGQISIDPHR